MSDTTQGIAQAHLGMMVWALIVGLSFPAVGLITEGLPPLLLTAIRFAIATLAIWPLVRRNPDFWPSLPGLTLYALMGLCLAGFFGTMFWAAHHTTALSMATLYVSVPLLAYCLGRMLGVEQRAGQLLGILALGAGGALATRLGGSLCAGRSNAIRCRRGGVLHWLRGFGALSGPEQMGAGPRMAIAECRAAYLMEPAGR